MATLLGIFSVFCILFNAASAQEACGTPNGRNGDCIVLQQCTSLYKLLLGPLSTEQRIFLKQSKCGRDGNKILVCCPRKDKTNSLANTFTIDDLPSNETCGVTVADKIIGGTKASISEFPWMALVHYTKRNQTAGEGMFLCGGSLIHEKYVLTAAHCIVNEKVARENLVLDSVRFGEHDLRADPDCQQDGQCTDPVENIPVAEIHVHENYEPKSRAQENDLALIRLERPAPYTDFIRPICLPILELQNKNYDESSLVVAGFGRTEDSFRSAVIMKAEIKGYNLATCTEMYHLLSRINLTESTQLCAGSEEGKDSCAGDSGGPLISEPSVADKEANSYLFSYLVGVVSFGPRTCGTPDFPGVYTRVDQYIEWILNHMRN